MKRLNNNKGLTLVELIVSVAILSIIVLPLLSSFVQATRTNVRAKNKQHAMETAQNILEGLQNTSIEDVACQFSDFTDNNSFDLFQINGAVTKKEVDYNGSSYVAHQSYASSGPTSDPVFTPKDTHIYYFYIEGMTVSNSNSKYDALITLDAKTRAVNDSYNSLKVANMQSVDTKFDAISSNADTKDIIIPAIQLQYGINGLQQSDISRTITIDIANILDGANTVTTVTASYKYYIRSRNITFPESGSLLEQDYKSVIYDNSTHPEDKLRNIYLFYYPWYTSTYSYPLCTDSIVINNPDEIDCSVHIIKQAVSDVNHILTDENGYKCAVYLNEVRNGGSGAHAHTVINTNLGKNIGIEDLDSPAANINGQATYIYNNTNANQNRVVGPGGIIKLNEMSTMEASDRLFDVKVDIFPSSVSMANISSETPLVTFTGGMTD